MYRFQIRAHTQPGEVISIVGSTTELRQWEVNKAIVLKTNPDSYPLWYTDLDIDIDRVPEQKIEYQYLRCYPDGEKQWESAHLNRWIPKESPSNLIVVDDGNFGEVQPYPYGYFLDASAVPDYPNPDKKVLIIGSSVAMGCSSWLLRGWAWRLGETLRKDYGYEVINRAVLGANVQTIIDRFTSLVTPHEPDIVIIALSLGNEGLANCLPQHRKTLQAKFERGLEKIVSLTREIGAQPILGGVYPHGNYREEDYALLQETRGKMLTSDVPVIDWLGVLDDGSGKWLTGISFDVAHPNMEGHRLMYEAIDLNLFPLLINAEKVKLVFQQGDLKIFQPTEKTLAITNNSGYEYNLQPMWKEARQALSKVAPGIYEDTRNFEVAFRTLIISESGLESRVKIPAKSLMFFKYQCKLTERKRIGIVSLGDRCALRMLLYKMQYDGPAFPFDLTRTTNLGDVADIIAQDFWDMWNPSFLHYSKEDNRIYHTKWSGLSFGHEIEESDDPERDMTPIWQRMKNRYSARAERFRYTIAHSDELLFVRTGEVSKGAVEDLVKKLTNKCNGKDFRLLILSSQSSLEFQGLPGVIHHDIEFNPDRMYADENHWRYCAEKMREILNSLGVSSKNLFWCPSELSKSCTF